MGKDPLEPSLDDKQLTGPVIQPLTEREIRLQLLFDSLQDKYSLLPIAVSVIAFIYSWLYAPIWGGWQTGLGAAIAAGLVGISAFIWRYCICYRQNYILKSRELVSARFEAQKRYLAAHSLAEAHDLLETGLSHVKAVEGLNILHALDHEYRSLEPVLGSGKETDLLSIFNLEVMLNETYFRGMSVLKDVVELERAIRATDEARLQAEITELRPKAAQARTDPGQHERAVEMDERIASNQDRIHILGQFRQRVEELLIQARRCEAALGKTRIELVVIKTGGSESGVDAVIEALRKTTDRASEVQEELKQMGY